MQDKKPVVLVVDDDPLMRFAAADAAMDAGFEVFEAQDAQDALRELEKRPQIQILFTDIDMPGMDGLKLAEAARRRWASLKVVLFSGKLVPEPGQIPAGGHFLSKPFWPGQVSATLNRALA